MQDVASQPESAPPAGTPRVDEEPVKIVPLSPEDDKVLSDALIHARKQGKFMVVIYAIEPQQDQPQCKLLMTRVQSSEFPNADYNECLRMLRENLARAVAGGRVEPDRK